MVLKYELPAGQSQRPNTRNVARAHRQDKTFMSRTEASSRKRLVLFDVEFF
jgi:hypothetical protein